MGQRIPIYCNIRTTKTQRVLTERVYMGVCECHDQVVKENVDIKFEMGRRFDQQGKMIKDLYDVLIGTIEKEGFIPEFRRSIKLFNSHVTESHEYRDIIMSNKSVCDKIKDSLGLTWNTILRTLASSITTSIILGGIWWVTNKR